MIKYNLTFTAEGSAEHYDAVEEKIAAKEFFDIMVGSNGPDLELNVVEAGRSLLEATNKQVARFLRLKLDIDNIYLSKYEEIE